MPRHALAPAYAALIVANLGWGIGFPLAKFALRELDAGSMILLHYAIAAVLVLPIIFNRAGPSIFTKPAVLAAGIFYGFAYLVQFEGVALTTVSMAALLIGVSPVLVALTARVLFRETITPIRWAGIAFAAAGAALVTRGSGESSASDIGLILISLVLCLGWIFALRKLDAGTDPVAASCAVVVIGALVIIPIVLVRSGMPPLQLAVATWASIIGQSVFSTAVAIVAWQLGASRVPAATAGVFLNVEPLVGALAGVLIFRDPVTTGILLGGTAIVAGSVLVTRGTRTAPAPA